MFIEGNYYDGKTSRSYPAHLEVLYDKEEAVRITLKSESDYTLELTYDALNIASRLGCAPREIAFGDGCLFVTEDNDSVDRLIKHHGNSKAEGLLHRLETNIPLILASAVVTIALIWVMAIYAIPAAAKVIAYELPDFTTEKLGTSLSILDHSVFDPTELSATKQAAIRKLAAPYLEHFKDLKPKLEFRSGMQANALALPNGEIILTDDFVNLVENDQELLAVFFHEIGHLKNKHLLRRALQDSMITLVVIFVTGDVETFDMITGLPTLVLDLSYSREFEREADLFALQQLYDFNISVDHFATAMQRLEQYYTDIDEDDVAEKLISKIDKKELKEDIKQDDSSFTDYLSTHPGTDERVELIKQFKLTHPEKN